MATAVLEVRGTGDFSQLQGAFTKAQAQAKSFGASMQSIGKSMSSVGKGLTLGLTLPLVAGFKKAIDAAGEAQRAMAQTNAVIKSTGGAAGVTAAAVVKMADAFSKTTLFTDDAIQSAENLLLTFTRIGSETFPRATDAVLDMSQAMGQDLQSTVVQVGKALNDPIKGITALSRVGVTFSQSQKDMIKSLVESGDIMKAQSVILDELEKEFGGAAEAAASTDWGQGQQAIKRLGEVLEDLGQTIAPIAADIFENLADKAESLAKWFNNLSPATKKIVTNLAAMAAAAGPLLFIFGKLTSAFGAIASLSGFSRVASGVSGIGTAAAGATPAIASLSGALGVVQAAAAGLVIGTAIQQGIVQPMLEAKWAAEDLRAEWEANIATFDRIGQAAPEIATGMHDVVTELEQMKLEGTLSAEAMERVFNGENVAVMRDAAEAGANMAAVTQAIAGGMSRAGVEAAIAAGSFSGAAVSVASVATAAGGVATAIGTASGKIQVFIETADGVKSITFDPLSQSAADLAKALGMPVGEVQNLINALNAVPKEITTTYTLKAIIDPVLGTAPVGPGLETPNVGDIFAGALAGGGPATAGEAYVVGEKGPEIFIPKSSGVVLPNPGAGGGAGGAADMVSGGNIQIVIDGRREDAEELAERVQRVLIQKTRRSGRTLEIA